MANYIFSRSHTKSAHAVHMQHCPSSVMNILCYHSNINYNRNNITTDGPLLRLPEPEGPLRLPKPEELLRLPKPEGPLRLPEPEGPLRLPLPEGPLRLAEPEGPLRLPKADGLFIKLICGRKFILSI